MAELGQGVGKALDVSRPIVEEVETHGGWREPGTASDMLDLCK